jgi:hypothetical protein
MQDLPVQVTDLHTVMVRDFDMTHPGACQVKGRSRPQSPGPGDQDAGVCQPRLTFGADSGKKGLPQISVITGIGLVHHDQAEALLRSRYS